MLIFELCLKESIRIYWADKAWAAISENPQAKIRKWPQAAGVCIA